MKKLVILRRSSQAAFSLLFLYILWSTTYPLTGLIHPEAIFRIDPLLIITTSVSERILLPGAGAALAMVAIASVFGRFFCGWVCPMGSAIDLAGSIRRRKRPIGDRGNRLLTFPKFFALGAIAVSAIFGRQIAWVLDPIALAARFVSLNLIPFVTGLVNAGFVTLIKDFRIEGPVPDLYHALKPSFLGVKIGYFANSPAILAYFLAVAGAGLLISRLWCRALCPLGAVYAVASARAPFHRIVDECKRCSLCSRECRTGAIREDMSYARGECVLCMDCVYTCPSRGVRFALSGPDKAAPAPRAKAPGGKGLSRRDFIVLLLSSLAALGFGRKPGVAGGDAPGRGAGVPTGLIRPPAALEEKDFTDRCVRCGNCMKVCITNGLQPTFLEAGYGGIWTPRLIPEIGCCEYRCTLCGDTCPTGAIPKLTLEEKMVTRLGLARIDASICLPYAQGKECLVCEEHCPAAEKAISLDPGPEPGVMRPRVIEELCVGCGACQNKCPVRPVRAIRVSANTAGRTAVGSRNLRAGNGYAR